MASCENVQTSEIESQGYSKSDDVVEVEAVEEVEDEEEDVDFNPFLKETLSPEASSSLSSEIEGDAVDSRANIRVTTDVDSSKVNNTKLRNSDVRDSEHCDEQIVMQSSASRELQINIDLSNATHSQTTMCLDDDEDDAICRRTRARYSLASFTLDELETFLQETDDEDDVQNVDDEEEYRKFLAAVLLGGNGDQPLTQESENADDEDEDNDADFEVELEEALESDYDEATLEKKQEEGNQRAGRKPETRQNRRQKASAQYDRKLLEQSKRPLRPLLPISPNGPIAPIPTFYGKTWMPEIYKSSLASAPVDGLINGFTPYQIGQLHCLIHEHVQLLIQLFSLCVLDHSRHHIASQVQGMIFEMLQKRDEAIACERKPYPDSCFKPPYVSSSVRNEAPLLHSTQNTSKASTFNANGICISPNTQMLDAQNIFSHGRGFEQFSNNGQLFPSWMPSLSGPLLSILDVAPFSLVRRYMDDVYSAVQEHRQRLLESVFTTQYEREPLFPLPCSPSIMEANNEESSSSVLPAACVVPSSVCQPPAKKTMAAILVEKTKKQSIALVPKDIAKLSQRFFPLFNPALFPHKPPPGTVANRVLFTDAEDELLALGLLEYNTDWKAIQQRFLPCKTKHQIFVRQKNRCSSKAPENPIKAVRRMKTSPLTAEEIQGIQEGLKAFKLDWMSVCKFIVPHRDPTLLPRQWRIALGTQRSYKLDAAKKEKRRLYESERRKRKAASMTNGQHASVKEDCQFTGVENCSGDDDIDNAEESYVHEGFLADWRPGITNIFSSERPCSIIGDKNPPTDMRTEESANVREQSNSYMSAVTRPLSGLIHGSPHVLNQSQHPYTVSHCASNALRPTHTAPSMISNASKSQIYLRPYRSRKSKNLVKLAPDLPPVNLPPSVRVIPQSALKFYQCGPYTKVSGTGDGVVDVGIGNTVSSFSGSAEPLVNKSDKSNPTKENVTNSDSAQSRVVKEKSVAEERSTRTDLQMHPLLFQAPEDGQAPYYPLNCEAGASSSFSLFPGNHPQLNLSLFYNPQQANNADDNLNKSLKMKETVSDSYGIDFHPLLQRTDETNSEPVTACAIASPSVGLDGKSSAPNSSNAVQMRPVVHCSSFSTRSRASSPNEKANELDLEIHLSSSSTKENAALSRGVTADLTNSSIRLINSQNATETLGTFHSSGNKFVSGAYSSTLSNKNIGRYIDDTCDQSHHEIVMEQEELSDSDEEVEEHVEFECEEMADSEGEGGSGCEQVSEMQEKYARGSMTDEYCNAQGSWLSLDAAATDHTSHAKPKNEASTISKCTPTKTSVSRRLNRPSKQATPSTRKVTLQEHAVDLPEQLCLGPLSVPTLRKPRKRTRPANKIANAGMTLGNLKKDAKDIG